MVQTVEDSDGAIRVRLDPKGDGAGQHQDVERELGAHDTRAGRATVSGGMRGDPSWSALTHPAESNLASCLEGPEHCI